MKLIEIKFSMSNFLNFFIFYALILLLLFHNTKSSKDDDKKEEIKFISPFNALYPNTTLEKTSNYEFADGPCSNQINCFLPYGICLNSTTCMCMPDYAHLYIEGYSLKNLSCSYKKKKMVVAGLLELFLPFGLGHFYVGHVLIGTLKLVYNFLVYSLCCSLYCKGFNNNEFADLMIFCVFLCCIIPLWNIFDIFLFFSGGYYDGYGIPLS